MIRMLALGLVLSSCVTSKPAEVAAPTPPPSCQSQINEFIATLAPGREFAGAQQVTKDAFAAAVNNRDQSVDVYLYIIDDSEDNQKIKQDKDFKREGKCVDKGRLVIIYSLHQLPQGA